MANQRLTPDEVTNSDEDANANATADADADADAAISTSIDADDHSESDNTSDTVPPNFFPRPLTAFDVFSFIANKMVGTGIYTAPPAVLILTGSKTVAMNLWVIGYLYAVISMCIYLYSASGLPYQTGEMVYLDELFSSRRTQTRQSWIRRKVRWYLGDGLLAYTLYTFLFVSLFNSGTNCMQTGRQLLLAIGLAQDPTEIVEPDGDLVRYIGITALSIICLIHYFSARTGRAVNRIFTVLKLLFLIILFIAGIVRAVRVGDGELVTSPFDEKHPTSFSNYAKAFLLVIFSFQGWENGNYVVGEIPRDRFDVLRNGCLSAVIVVGGLYVGLNAVFLYSLPYSHSQVGYAAEFFGNSEKANRAWAFLIAVSAVGSLVSIIYTFARVKQCIGNANVLPWSRFWKQDDPAHSREVDEVEKTPMGGLILHWLTTVVMISVTAAVPDLVEGIGLPGFLQSYSHCLIATMISIGIFRLPARARDLHREIDNLWHYKTFTSCLGLCVTAPLLLVYCGCNLFLLVAVVIPPYTALDGTTKGVVPGYLYMAILSYILLLGCLYYTAIFGAFLDDSPMHWSLLRLADVSCTITKDEDYERFRAQRFGCRRRINFKDGPNAENLFWLFGGLLDYSPRQKITDTWIELTDQISHRLGWSREEGDASD